MNILRKILTRRFETVTFDIFDTLIERCVATPQKIFYLAGADVLGEEKADAFFAARCEAERTARERRSDREVTLAEIYAELRPVYEEKTEALMQAEIHRELISCHPKLRNVAWMRWCLEKHKRVFLISDMYLPPSVIEGMLDRCGIRGYERLYVSGAYRQSKITGDLFRTVIRENLLNPKRILHAGDSFRADVLGAHMAKIIACWVCDVKVIKRIILSCMNTCVGIVR